jgi:hypothetical protein
MTPDQFLSILHETIDENPFAARAVLRILEVEFTDAVATLAVSCQDRPRLLVNLDFVSRHCHTDDHVKAVLCHEFLHVLLRHTETIGALTRARHLAFDAVINAIISREQGPSYASFFSLYYENEVGITRLLRPLTQAESGIYADFGALVEEEQPVWARAWVGLYKGWLVADDIEDIVKAIDPSELGDGISDLVGNHAELGSRPASVLSDALDEAMRELNGSGIWKSPTSRGVRASAYDALVKAANLPLQHWKSQTVAVLKRHLVPSRYARALEEQALDYRIPVLSQSDRRAFIRTLWDPILPQALWQGTVKKPRASAQVYLDVSGSMNAEMPALIALLNQISDHIQRPFWAFSDEVSPATIEGGVLKTQSSGGTSMDCVLDHIALTQPKAAVVITDGYIEKLSRQSVAARLGRTRFHAIVSRAGSASLLRSAGIDYTQLQGLPK